MGLEILAAERTNISACVLAFCQGSWRFSRRYLKFHNELAIQMVLMILVQSFVLLTEISSRSVSLSHIYCSFLTLSNVF